MLKTLVTIATFSLVSFTSPKAGITNSVAIEATDLSNSGTTMSMAEKKAAFEGHVQQVYTTIGLKSAGLDAEVFKKAYVGFQNLKIQGKTSPTKSILTIVDFTKSSNKKRLWTIDLNSGKVLMNSLVAHGRNTGEGKAEKFSNTPNSYMSSLGFYVTDKTYFGKHGLSLKLRGMDQGFNTNAMSRAIVVHGADYATAEFVKQYGRLGRSLGCPAVPKELSKELIETIKDETVLYIHGADSKYTSNYLDENNILDSFAQNVTAASGTDI